MVLLATTLCLVAQAGPYDADPKHPWNELHEALFTWRPTKPGKIPAGLQSDPLFWPPGSQEWAFSAVLLPMLDRFLEKGSDALVKDPLKRAVLQRDLWMLLANGIPLRTTTVEQEAEATMKWKQADKSGEFLRRFWPKE